MVGADARGDPGARRAARPERSARVTHGLESRAPPDARVVFDVGEGEVEYEGDRAHPVETYHGHVWRAYDMMGNLLGSFTVNAAEGYRQEFRTEL